MGNLLLKAGAQDFVPNGKTTAISIQITNSVKITFNISNFKKLPVTANSRARFFHECMGNMERDLIVKNSITSLS